MRNAAPGLLILLTLFLSSVESNEPHVITSAPRTTPSSPALSAQSVAYRGNTLFLNGNVHLSHPLGDLSALKGRVEREDKGGNQFSFIQLLDRVQIVLRDRGSIACGKAEFDFLAMEGNLYSDAKEGVHFDMHTPRYPLSLSTNQAHVSLAKEGESIRVVRINIPSTIDAKYGEDIALRGDRALFLNESIPHLFVHSNCVFTHAKDLVTSSDVEFFPEKEQIHLLNSTGIFNSSLYAPLHFSALEMLVDLLAEKISLNGNVEIFHPEHWKLCCLDQIDIYKKEENGQSTIRQITTKGKTSLMAFLEEKASHALHSSRSIRLDRDRQMVIAEGSTEDPVTYVRGEVVISSNRAELSYEDSRGQLSPKKLQLLGAVRLHKEKEPHRFALGDHFVYQCNDQTAILSSEEGQKVVFVDEEQGISISALQVHISRGENGDVIKGVGDVRFALSSNEHALIKKVFPFYQPKGGNRE